MTIPYLLWESKGALVTQPPMQHSPQEMERPERDKQVVTWRIIPVSKWINTMVIVSPLTGVVPLPNCLFMAYKWGVPNYLLTGMILQVTIP